MGGLLLASRSISSLSATSPGFRSIRVWSSRAASAASAIAPMTSIARMVVPPVASTSCLGLATPISELPTRTLWSPGPRPSPRSATDSPRTMRTRGWRSRRLRLPRRSVARLTSSRSTSCLSCALSAAAGASSSPWPSSNAGSNGAPLSRWRADDTGLCNRLSQRRRCKSRGARQVCASPSDPDHLLKFDSKRPRRDLLRRSFAPRGSGKIDGDFQGGPRLRLGRHASTVLLSNDRSESRARGRPDNPAKCGRFNPRRPFAQLKRLGRQGLA